MPQADPNVKVGFGSSLVAAVRGWVRRRCCVGLGGYGLYGFVASKGRGIASDLP
jgi:hypothetical protein